MAAMVEITCKNPSCKKKKLVRASDIKRGWGKFCSKRCKAEEQERRTGQYKGYLCARINGMTKNEKDDDGFHACFSNEDNMDIDFESGCWDAHKDSY